VLDLVKSNGDIWDGLLKWDRRADKILFYGGFWTRTFPVHKVGYTISDTEFIQKYGNTDQPDTEPAWTFKTDEELKNFLAKFMCSKYATLDAYLTSIRTPAFELVTADNVTVTDRDQVLWVINGDQIVQYDAYFVGVKECFSTKDAAVAHRLHTTPAIKLSDMTFENDYYWISGNVAHNLVNERING
jgi:hypothetical protein